MKITTSLPRIIIPSCIGVMMCASAFASGTAPEYYTDYPLKNRKCHSPAARLYQRASRKDHRLMMNHVLDDINNGKIASVKTLASLRKKKLSTEDLYDLCRKSTLVFGKMEHVGYLGKDSAYSNASAVALTPDGICATNFHVISDIVICGAFDYKNRVTAPGS